VTTDPQAAAPDPALATAPVFDRRLLGKRLSALANAQAGEVLALHSGAAPVPSAARRIGLTGPPGAGKSTLGGHLAVLRSSQRRVGLLAIDPSSPVSGGAILGDRIRMDDLPGIERLYVRSIASRTAGDGLAPNIAELLAAMEGAGFDELLLETVGVGQVEHAVRHQVDTAVLVLVPGAGDYVQAMKAGIMETADILAINKSDLPGADRLVAEIAGVLRFAARASDWTPAVVRTAMSDAGSVAELSAAIDRHQAWLDAHDNAAHRLLQRQRYRLRSLLERCLVETVSDLDPAFFDASLQQQAQAVVRDLQAALAAVPPAAAPDPLRA
jgi:LAO/AO transport system kinase